MMSEMAKRLRDRKAKAEMNSQSNEREAADGSAEQAHHKTPSTKIKAPVNTDSNMKKVTGTESPSVGRKVRFVDEAPVTAPAEVTSSSRAGELESLKQELLAEMRHELQKVKNEIVQAILAELNKK